jgi:predicted transposase YbfD/YdcC
MSIRGHWLVENSSHYVLDVTFSEDAFRICRDYSPENMEIVRRLASGLLKNETTIKRSIKQKLKLANRDVTYIEKVLKMNVS